MATYVVECITLEENSRFDDCRSIDQIGFEAQTTGTVLKTPAEVYDWVENQGHTVVVEHNGRRTEVHGSTYNGTKYVKTEPNDTEDDNLLKQTSC